MSRPMRSTPCVGICSTTYGDLVCRGCKRFSHEIVAWNVFTDDQRERVWTRLHALRDQATGVFVTVLDEQTVARCGSGSANRIAHRRFSADVGLRTAAAESAGSAFSARDRARRVGPQSRRSDCRTRRDRCRIPRSVGGLLRAQLPHAGRFIVAAPHSTHERCSTAQRRSVGTRPPRRSAHAVDRSCQLREEGGGDGVEPALPLRRQARTVATDVATRARGARHYEQVLVDHGHAGSRIRSSHPWSIRGCDASADTHFGARPPGRYTPRRRSGGGAFVRTVCGLAARFEGRLAAFYERLLESEARHAGIYLDLARRYAADDVLLESRLSVFVGCDSGADPGTRRAVQISQWPANGNCSSVKVPSYRSSQPQRFQSPRT